MVLFFSCLMAFLFFLHQFIIGDGNNMYDFTYVENVAHAHICAEQTLASEGSKAEEAAGKVYTSFGCTLYLCSKLQIFNFGWTPDNLCWPF